MKLGNAARTVELFWQEVRHYPLYWISLLVLVPLGVFLINYAQPYIVAEAIDRLSQGAVPADRIWEVFGTLIILFVLSAVIGELIVWRLIVWLVWNLEKRVVFNLYQRSFGHLSALSTRFHATRFGGTLVSQANKFSSGYVRLADSLVFNVLPTFSAIAFTFIILAPRVPLFTLGLAILCGMFITVAVRSFSRIRSLNEVETEANNKLSGLTADAVSNIMAVKSFGQEEAEALRFKQANYRAQHATDRLIKAIIKRDIGFGFILSLIGIFMFLVLISGPSVLGVSIGTLVLISTYSFGIFNRLWNFNGILRSVNQALGDAAPMTQILDTELEVKDIENPEPMTITDGAIAFQHMTYAHADDKNDVLFKDFDLEIAGGQKVGLVGPSGSGKTTLTRLLLRFSDIDAGSICIDGRDIAKVSQAELRRQIAYVPQEPMLFHRTIAENITYGRPDAEEATIREAAKRAHALNFIDKLPHGFDTIVGERGVKLSGGQRQRIAIARAIIKDAPIIVLDEATSALDSQSERLIQEAMHELMEGRTAIVIAHRLSTIQEMDQILVLDQGQIIESGPHEQLLARGGTYAELWRHQSGGFMN